MPKSYLTHDNGGRPFEVEKTEEQVHVYLYEWQEDNTYIRGKRVVTTPYEHFFVGEDEDSPGNSVLIKVSAKKYIYVGEQIYSFSPMKGDTIISYASPIGGNDVPYPYAIGNQYTYIMLENVAIPNKLLNFKENIYEQWYGLLDIQECKSDSSYKKSPFCKSLLANKADVKRKIAIRRKNKTIKLKKIHNRPE